MFGLLGILFPRRSKNFNEYSGYIERRDLNGAIQFILSLENKEAERLFKEILSFHVDKQEQEFIQSIKKEIEDRSYPIMFSSN